MRDVIVGAVIVVAAVTAIETLLRLRARRAVDRPGPVAGIVINAAAALTTLGLAVIAGAISYDHLRQLAESRGEHGWKAHAFPLTVDGIEVVATLAILSDRRAGRASGWIPWTSLAAGAAASLGANILVAQEDLIARVIAGWPAVALMAAIKLLSGMLEHTTSAQTPPAAASRAESSPIARTTTAANAHGANDATSTRHGEGSDPETDPNSDKDEVQPAEASDQTWPVDLVRRIPVNIDRYQRWQAAWGDIRAGEADLHVVAERHGFDLRSVQFVRRAGEIGMLDHPVPLARRLAALAPLPPLTPANGHQNHAQETSREPLNGAL